MAPAGAPPKIQKPMAASVSQLLDSITRDIDERGRYKAYLITNCLTAEHYVGITERKLRDRWKQHIVGGSSGTGYLLHKVMQRDGIENFTFEFIACAIDRHALHFLEMQLIAQNQSVERGYNQTRGGATGEAVGTEIKVAGRTFISISSAAREFNVDEDTAFQRLSRHGWSVEQAFGVAPPPVRNGRITNYQFDGQTFVNFVAACKTFGLDESVVRRRIKGGWTERQAFALDPAPARLAHNVRTVEVEGVTYPSLRTAAETYGMKEHTLAKRLRVGWTVEQTFKLAPPPQQKTSGKAINVQGQEYTNISQAARANAIRQDVVNSRLRQGWSIEQALGLEVRLQPGPRKGLVRHRSGSEIAVNGVSYDSREKAAKSLGLDPRIVHKRLKIFGWTLDQAFGMDDPPSRLSNSSKSITVQGKTYPTIADACVAFGITPSAVNRRVASGMQLEDAIAKRSRKAQKS